MASKYLLNLVKKYNVEKDNPRFDTELEIRMPIDENIMHKLLTHYNKEKITIEQSINIINDLGIRKLYIEKGERNQIVHYTKNQIAKAFMRNKLFDYKVVLSQETIIDPYTITNIKLIRFKYRYSIQLTDWRIDITLNYSLNNIDDIKNVKSRFFSTDDSRPDMSFVSNIELEIERTTMDRISDSDIHDIINEIFNIIDKDYMDSVVYQQMIYNVATLLFGSNESYKYKSSFGLKQMYSKVKDLTKNNLPNVQNSLGEYYITDKADGERAIIYIVDNYIHYLTHKLATIEISNKQSNDKQQIIILDAEIINGKAYIFDVLYINNKNLVADKAILSERLSYMSKVISMYKYHDIAAKSLIKLDNDLDKSKKILTEYIKYADKLPYKRDGYIMSPNVAYRDMVSLKIKNLEDITIDFLLVKVPDEYIKIEPYISILNRYKDNKLKDKSKKQSKNKSKNESKNETKVNLTFYFLFNGITTINLSRLKMKKVKGYDTLFKDMFITNKQYIPIQFSPSSNPLAYCYIHDENDENNINDNNLNFRVCEMFYSIKDNQWSIRKIREDRDVEVKRGNYYGNDFMIAETIYESYYNPVLIEDLYKSTSDYFAVHNNPLYKLMRNYNSGVKSYLMKEFGNKSDIKVAIDLGSGKGQDMQRYIKFDKVLFIDKDAAAIQELISRKKTMRNDLLVHTITTDLTIDYKQTVDKIHQIGYQRVPFVVCNMSIHYLVSSELQLKNFVNLVDNIITVGGHFLFTCFNGQTVFDLLENSNGEYTAHEEEVLKYNIKREYKSNSLQFGQKINVLLPFSNGQYYEETLVPIELVIELFKKMNYSLVLCKSFTSFSKEVDIKLPAIDKEFISLYTAVVLKKKK